MAGLQSFLAQLAIQLHIALKSRPIYDFRISSDGNLGVIFGSNVSFVMFEKRKLVVVAVVDKHLPSLRGFHSDRSVMPKKP